MKHKETNRNAELEDHVQGNDQLDSVSGGVFVPGRTYTLLGSAPAPAQGLSGSDNTAGEPFGSDGGVGG